jgi:hypothetical protein
MWNEIRCSVKQQMPIYRWQGNQKEPGTNKFRTFWSRFKSMTREYPGNHLNRARERSVKPVQLLLDDH